MDLGIKELRILKNLLVQWVQEPLDHAEETVEGLLESQQNIASPLDKASFESNRITKLRIRNKKSDLIKSH